MVVVEKKYHQSLFLSSSAYLDVHMDVFLVSSLLVLVGDRVDLESVVLDQNSEGFVEVGELRWVIVIDFDECSIKSLQV